MTRILSVAATLCMLAEAALADPERADFQVTSEPNVGIAIREVVDPDIPRRGEPVILLHGARVPGVPSFDLAVPNGSLAADLAAAGLRVYIVDLRGYGASSRPAAMREAPRVTKPLVRSGTAARDLGTAVDAILERTRAAQVAIVGWATGGHWAGLYGTLNPDKVSKIVFYNTLYGYGRDHPTIGRGSGLADPNSPDRFNLERFKNYRVNSADSLLPSWDRSIPLDDKTAWRDPVVANAYVEAALASDPTSEERDPPSFRAPSGAMADSFLLATGAALWDARALNADTLVVRSGNDFWSRPEDVVMLKQHLEQRLAQASVETLTIADATHYVHLDRPERGRRAFLDAVIGFLAEVEG